MGQPSVSSITQLAWYFRLYQLRKQCKRLLPAEIASLGWNSFGKLLLHYVQLGSAEHRLEGDRRLDFSRQVRIIKLVRVSNAFVWHQLKILSTK